MSNILREIEEEENFVALVKELRSAVVWPLSAFYNNENVVDEGLAKLAHTNYKLSIDQFAAYLESSNPDHYKRCGALMHALYQNPVVKAQNIDIDPDEVRNGFSQFPVAEQDGIAKAIEFHQAYFPIFAVLDLCLKICNSYEDNPRNVNFETIYSICHYVRHNDLPLDSFYMIFRLLMA